MQLVGKGSDGKRIGRCEWGAGLRYSLTIEIGLRTTDKRGG